MQWAHPDSLVLLHSINLRAMSLRSLFPSAYAGQLGRIDDDMIPGGMWIDGALYCTLATQYKATADGNNAAI